MAFYRHRATQGQRWDTLAAQYYGNPYDYDGIIAANPSLQGIAELDAGVVVNVPIKPSAQTRKRPTIKPPWKQ